MARTGQKLINYHSSGSSEIVLTNLDYGEIAVRHKPDQPELIIKTGTDTKAVFIDSQAIDSKISASQVNIEGQLEAIDERLDTIESGYAKSGVVNTLVSTEKANAVSSSKGYTDAVVSEASAATLSVVSANYATITQHNALNNTVTGHTAAINSADTRLATIESGYAQSAVVNSLINNKISNVYKFKGSVNTYADLASITTKENGDVYNVISGNGTTPPGTNYAWAASGTSGSWDALGGSIDLSIYVTSGDFDTLNNTVTAHTAAINSANTRLNAIETGYAQSAVVTALVSTEKANAVSSSKGYTDAVVSEASAATLSVVSANYATITQHNALNNTVTGHTAAINSANTRLNAIEPKANSALQGFKLTGTSATTGTGNQTTQYGAVANFTTGGNATLDLSNLIIDCGDF